MDQLSYLKADKRFQTAWRSLGSGVAMLVVAAALIWILVASWRAEPVQAEEPAPRPRAKAAAKQEAPPIEVGEIPGTLKFVFLGVGALILTRTGILVIKDSLPKRPRTMPRA